MMKTLHSLWTYRELLKTNIKKDIRGRYKGSILGMLWSFLNPLLQVFVYYLVCPYLFGNVVDHYLIYLITGLIPWTFFLTTIQAGTGTIKANAGIVKKVYFPREILMISQVCSGLINFFISCLIIILFCLADGVGLGWQLLMVPLIALIEAVLIFGIILICGSVNVYVQDLEYIVQFLLQMAFYAAPVIYSITQFSNAGWLLKVIEINPFTVLLEGYRDCFLYHVWPAWQPLLGVLLLGLVLCLIGMLVFRRLERGFAEEL